MLSSVSHLENSIFAVSNDAEFSKVALEVFRFQAEAVPVYKDYLNLLGVKAAAIKKVEDIPFLPISFFKSHRVLAEGAIESMVFESSGTTGVQTSRHLVASTELYKQSFSRTFKYFFGEPADWCIMALLPSYLERSASSLVYMTESLIKESGHPDGGFYLDNLAELEKALKKLDRLGQKTMLLGVSFALLDLAESFPATYKHLTVIETGGMKGRRREIVREALHSEIRKAFGLTQVASEYGMTELLSQAYALKDGVFFCPPWMKVFIRDIHDPFSLRRDQRTGGINVVDLANLYSCSFLATQDLGQVNLDGGFQVLGRFDASDIRGCNLLVS